MDRDEVIRLVDERIQPVMQQLKDFIAAENQSRETLERLVGRLTLVIAGDEKFQQKGLTHRLNEVEKQVESIQRLITESTAIVRSWLLVGGGFVTVLNIGIVIYGKVRS